MLLRRATDLSLDIVSELVPFCNKIQVVGAVRRKDHDIHEIDILIDCPCYPELIELIKSKWEIIEDIFCTHFIVYKEEPISAKLHSADEHTWGVKEILKTGPRNFNIEICNHAMFVGYKISGRGYLLDRNNEKLYFHREGEVFNYLGMGYFAPDNRWEW